MKLIRPTVFAIILAAVFFYFTTYRSANSPNWLSHPQHVEVTEAASGESLDTEEQNNIAVYRKNIGSVVNITSRVMTSTSFMEPCPRKARAPASSSIRMATFSPTSTSSKMRAKSEVTLHNRKKYKATIVGTDKSHDLAIVQIKAPELVPMVLGDSTNLQVGQKVYAIGNPFGLAGTLTRGIVSSIRPVQEPDGMAIDEAIQTDAAINPGNSGGPLLNWHGEVIGINTMIASNVGQSAGIGFAIPINTAKAVLNDLVTLGRVRRPALGIRTIPIDPELAGEMDLPADYGLLIVQAVSGGAAEHAGLLGGTERAYLGNTPIMIGGDLIIAIDGEKIETQQDLAQAMNRHRAGDTIKVTIYRGKKKQEVNVVLGEARDQV